MNYKKLTSLLIIPALFCQTTVFAAKLSIDEINISLDTVTVHGTLDGTGNADILMYVAQDSDEAGAEDVNYAAQITTEEDGSFSAEFLLNEELINNDGNLFIYANSEAADAPVRKSFLYADSEKRKALLDAINNARSADEMKAAIEENSSVCSALGMSMTCDVSRELFDERPQGGYTEENLTVLYNTKVFLKTVNSAKDPDTIKSCFEDFKSLIEERHEEAEDFIAEVMSAEIPYAGIEELYNGYDTASAFYEINNAGRDTFAEVLEEHAQLIGIASDSAYQEYKNAGGEKKVFITKALIETASDTPFKSVGELTAALKSAADDWDDKGSTNGGSSSGRNPGSSNGGSQSSSDGSFAISTPQAGQNMESALNPQDETDPDVRLFSDVAENFWAAEAIETLARMKILNGDDGMFRPNDKITREEFVTVVVNAFDLYSDSAVSDFKDASGSAWYYPYISSAYESGIISGMGDGNFGIGSPIKREDVAVILARLSNAGDDGAYPDFTDSETISDYAKGAVAHMQTMGIISGMEDGSFAPKANCTRAEAATMIYLLLDKQGGIN